MLLPLVILGLVDALHPRHSRIHHIPHHRHPHHVWAATGDYTDDDLSCRTSLGTLANDYYGFYYASHRQLLPADPDQIVATSVQPKDWVDFTNYKSGRNLASCAINQGVVLWLFAGEAMPTAVEPNADALSVALKASGVVAVSIRPDHHFILYSDGATVWMFQAYQDMYTMKDFLEGNDDLGENFKKMRTFWGLTGDALAPPTVDAVIAQLKLTLGNDKSQSIPAHVLLFGELLVDNKVAAPLISFQQIFALNSRLAKADCDSRLALAASGSAAVKTAFEGKLPACPTDQAIEDPFCSCAADDQQEPKICLKEEWCSTTFDDKSMCSTVPLCDANTPLGSVCQCGKQQCYRDLCDDPFNSCEVAACPTNGPNDELLCQCGGNDQSSGGGQCEAGQYCELKKTEFQSMLGGTKTSLDYSCKAPCTMGIDETNKDQCVCKWNDATTLCQKDQYCTSAKGCCSNVIRGMAWWCTTTAWTQQQQQ